MRVIGMLGSQPWVERLGWTLVHFIWQGTAIAAVYAAARAGLMRGRSSNARYLLACGALLLMTAAPIATWISLAPAMDTVPAAPDRTATIPGFKSINATSVTPLPEAVRSTVPRQKTPDFLPWVVVIWMLGTTAFWIRLLGGWAAAAGARSTTSRPAPAEWQRRLDVLRTRLAVSRPVRLLVSAWAQTPMVIGWLKPVVLVPIGALNRLPAEFVETLLMHELAHIRRQDYLMNLAQSVAESLLFYHPAVWWVSGHIRAEREACCDDIAVRESGDVLAYASALAELEAQRTGLRLAMGASGGSLADRVARLVGESRPTDGRGFGPAAAIGAVLLLAAYGLFGQEQKPAFQAASIKPNPQLHQSYRGVRPLPGGRIATDNAPVVMLIQNAYQLQAYQIIGGPEWINTDGYDIEAKPDHQASRSEAWLMLRTLLADRFKLAVHRETRELPVFALTAAKGGVRLPAPRDPNCEPIDPARPIDPANPPPPPPMGRGPCGKVVISGSPDGSKMSGESVGTAEFIRMLAALLGRPVLDKTGFTGKTDIDLRFTPDEITQGLPGAGGPHDPGGAPMPVNSDRPNIVGALQEQLGLKLEKTKGPVEVVVVDHVERPTAN